MFYFYVSEFLHKALRDNFWYNIIPFYFISETHTRNSHVKFCVEIHSHNNETLPLPQFLDNEQTEVCTPLSLLSGTLWCNLMSLNERFIDLFKFLWSKISINWLLWELKFDLSTPQNLSSTYCQVRWCWIFPIKISQWILDGTLDHLISIASKWQDKQKRLMWSKVSLRNDKDMGVLQW